MPRLDFPRFYGDQPKLWIRRATDYFDLYAFNPDYWIRLAAMNFSAAASNWLQSVDSKMRDCSWTEFCQLLLDRFGRDEHELLLRCLFNIRQTTTVSDYIDKFAELVD